MRNLRKVPCPSHGESAHQPHDLGHRVEPTCQTKTRLAVGLPVRVPPSSLDDLEFLLYPKDQLVVHRVATRKSVFVYPLQSIVPRWSDASPKHPPTESIGSSDATFLGRHGKKITSPTEKESRPDISSNVSKLKHPG